MQTKHRMALDRELKPAKKTNLEWRLSLTKVSSALYFLLTFFHHFKVMFIPKIITFITSPKHLKKVSVWSVQARRFQRHLFLFHWLSHTSHTWYWRHCMLFYSCCHLLTSLSNSVLENLRCSLTNHLANHLAAFLTILSVSVACQCRCRVHPPPPLYIQWFSFISPRNTQLGSSVSNTISIWTSGGIDLSCLGLLPPLWHNLPTKSKS